MSRSGITCYKSSYPITCNDIVSHVITTCNTWYIVSLSSNQPVGPTTGVFQLQVIIFHEQQSWVLLSPWWVITASPPNHGPVLFLEKWRRHLTPHLSSCVCVFLATLVTTCGAFTNSTCASHSMVPEAVSLGVNKLLETCGELPVQAFDVVVLVDVICTLLQLFP